MFDEKMYFNEKIGLKGTAMFEDMYGVFQPLLEASGASLVMEAAKRDDYTTSIHYTSDKLGDIKITKINEGDLFRPYSIKLENSNSDTELYISIPLNAKSEPSFYFLDKEGVMLFYGRNCSGIDFYDNSSISDRQALGGKRAPMSNHDFECFGIIPDGHQDVLGENPVDKIKGCCEIAAKKNIKSKN